MERRSVLKLMGATAAMAGTGLMATKASAAGNVTIALIPGLTADGFYVTMHKGAVAAAKALGVDLLYQGAAKWDATLQIPIVEAIIAKKPAAILIAPNDKQQLVEPLKKAFDAGIQIVCVDTFIGNGVFQTGAGDADFPISYVASDNVLGGRMAAAALAKAIGEKGKVYVSNTNPNVSTTDQREEGFKEEMKAYPNIEVLETAVQRRRRQQGGGAGSKRCSAARLISPACSAPICSRLPAPRNGVKQAGKSRQGQDRGV